MGVVRTGCGAGSACIARSDSGVLIVSSCPDSIAFRRTARTALALGNALASRSGFGFLYSDPHFPHCFAHLILPGPPPLAFLLRPGLEGDLRLTGGIESLSPPQIGHHAVWSITPGGIERTSRMRAKCSAARAGEMGSRRGGMLSRWAKVVGVGWSLGKKRDRALGGAAAGEVSIDIPLDRPVRSSAVVRPFLLSCCVSRYVADALCDDLTANWVANKTIVS